jgi:hypothetical protein
MMCQLLLPFAHAAVMQSDVTPSWCGSEANVGDFSSELVYGQGSHEPKALFCPVCVTSSGHVFGALFNVNLVPAQIEYLGVLLPELNIHFIAPALAISPPARGPPLSC